MSSCNFSTKLIFGFFLFSSIILSWISCDVSMKLNITKSEVATSRQAPLNAALVGFFAPPFVAFVSMSALLYTFEKFTKDMMKEVSNRGRLRFRRKKKKTPQQPAQSPPAAAATKQLIREHRALIKGFKNNRPLKSIDVY